jgi:hypothetical protein
MPAATADAAENAGADLAACRTGSRDARLPLRSRRRSVEGCACGCGTAREQDRNRRRDARCCCVRAARARTSAAGRVISGSILECGADLIGNSDVVVGDTGAAVSVIVCVTVAGGKLGVQRQYAG